VEPLVEPGPPPPRPRRRWIAPLVLLAVASAIPLVPRQAPPDAERRGVANTPPALRFIALPRGLSDRTTGSQVRIAFSATQPVPEGRGALHQLWRLELPTGELTSGPIVGEVLALRYSPKDSGRLAFLVSGGGLFVLDGFLASRPTWVDGDVSSFDFAVDGTLVYAKVERRTAPSGRAVAAVRIGVVEPDRTTPSNVRSRTIRSLNLRGYSVRGWRLVAWGVRGGQEQVLVWSARGGDVRRAPGLRVTPRARTAAGSWVISPPGASLSLPGIPSDPTHLAIGGGLAIWAGGEGLTVASLGRPRIYHVELPPRFPKPAGPVAAS